MEGQVSTNGCQCLVSPANSDQAFPCDSLKSSRHLWDGYSCPLLLRLGKLRHSELRALRIHICQILRATSRFANDGSSARCAWITVAAAPSDLVAPPARGRCVSAFFPHGGRERWVYHCLTPRWGHRCRQVLAQVLVEGEVNGGGLTQPLLLTAAVVTAGAKRTAPGSRAASTHRTSPHPLGGPM